MADTAVSIGCRKTIEVAGRLTSWLERSDALPGEIKPVIETALESAALDLRRVMRSVELSPCVGLVGGADQNRLDLAAAALFQDNSAISELSQLRHQQQDFGSIVRGITGDEQGVALRFCSQRHRDPIASANRFPVQVELLNALDIIKIIVNAYYSNIPGAASRSLKHSEIERAIKQVDQELSIAGTTGLSSDDIANLRQFLWAEFPRVERFRSLSLCGYWDWLSTHISHLSLEGRCQVLSHLWDFEPNFTQLYRRLSEALRDLGYANSVHVSVDAILATDDQTGVLAPHRKSLLRRSAITELLRQPIPEPDLAVSIAQGTVRNSHSAAVAALAHTVTLRVSRAHPFPLEATDLKVFPSTPSETDLLRSLLDENGAQSVLQGDEVEQLYARNKAIHVFSRACTGSELSAVVVLADAEQNPDDVHMPAISDWIDLSEGADPRSRERMESCLAVLVKSPYHDADGGASPRIDRAEQNAFVASLLGENNRWAQEWTPGRPFSQVHFVPEFSDLERGVSTGAARPNNMVHLEDAIFPSRLPTARPTSLAVSILLDISENSSQVVRSRQSRRQLATIQRAMQARLFRYHRSNNPAQFTDWRRQIANVATKRLEAAVDARQLGNMLDALSLSPADIHLLLAGLKSGAVATDDVDEYSLDIDIRGTSLPEPSICAAATVSAWLKLMLEAVGSRQLCNQLDIAQPVFQHIVDEVIIGAQRAELVNTLTQRFEQVLEASTPMSDLARSYALIASRMLGRFLERLDKGSKATHGAASAGPMRPAAGMAPGSRLTRHMGAREAHGSTSEHTRPQGALAGERANDGYPLADWPAQFRKMVDDNIIAAESMTAHSQSDHELGEYLSMLTSNPLEVEL